MRSTYFKKNTVLKQRQNYFFTYRKKKHNLDNKVLSNFGTAFFEILVIIRVAKKPGKTWSLRNFEKKPVI